MSTAREHPCYDRFALYLAESEAICEVDIQGGREHESL